MDVTNDREGQGVSGEPMTAGRRGSWLYWVIGLTVALLAWNATVYVPVARALSDEEGARTVVYRKWLISPTDVVFDVWSVSGTMSIADMDRRFLKTAEALQDKSFTTVTLAYRGRGKFLFDGAQFQEIGQTRQSQNPLYTIHTMQEFVLDLDGTPAFGAWTGGLLGVFAKQMEDHNELHQRWWIEEAIGG